MCPELGHILAVVITHKRTDPVRLCGPITGSGYMPLLQLNRALRYILYVISQQ